MENWIQTKEKFKRKRKWNNNTKISKLKKGKWASQRNCEQISNQPSGRSILETFLDKNKIFCFQFFATPLNFYGILCMFLFQHCIDYPVKYPFHWILRFFFSFLLSFRIPKSLSLSLSLTMQTCVRAYTRYSLWRLLCYCYFFTAALPLPPPKSSSLSSSSPPPANKFNFYSNNMKVKWEGEKN